VHFQLTSVPFDQLGKGVRVAGLCPGDKISFDENTPIRIATAGSRAQLPV